MRPREYGLPYAVIRQTSYQCTEPDGSSALLRSGILQPGRVVWLHRLPEVQQQRVHGFTEGIGIVEVDVQVLQRA